MALKKKKKKVLHTMRFTLPQTKNQSISNTVSPAIKAWGAWWGEGVREGRVRAEQMVDGRLSAEGQGAGITDAVSDLVLLPCSLKPG